MAFAVPVVDNKPGVEATIHEESSSSGSSIKKYVPKLGCNKKKADDDKPLVTGKRIDTWPLVPCSTQGCTIVRKWRVMDEVRTTLYQSSGRWGDDDDIVDFKYVCAECRALEWGITVQEAQARILENRPSMLRRKKYNEAFRTADAKSAAAFPGMSKGERRLVTIASMKEIIAPLAKFIQLKARMRRARSDMIDEHKLLIDQLANAKSIEEANEVLPNIEHLENMIEEASGPLAFKAKGKEHIIFVLLPITMTAGRPLTERMGPSRLQCAPSTCAPQEETTKVIGATHSSKARVGHNSLRRRGPPGSGGTARSATRGTALVWACWWSCAHQMATSSGSQQPTQGRSRTASG
jgi:hypothetical protein